MGFAIARRRFKFGAPHSNATLANPGFGLNISIAEVGQGDRKPRFHHYSRKIQFAGPAAGDDAMIGISIVLATDYRLTFSKAGQQCSSVLPTAPRFTITGARLPCLKCIDPVQANTLIAKLEGIAINDLGGAGDDLRLRADREDEQDGEE